MSIPTPSTGTVPTPKQQFAELIKRSQKILLLTHVNPDGDALGSILAMRTALQTLGKDVSVALSGKRPNHLHFLPDFNVVTEETDGTLNKDILISIDESQASVANVAVKRVGEHKLMLVITPENGTLTAQNLRIEEGSYQLDLIISLDSNSLERTGSLMQTNPDLFYEVPVVNIDHHVDNNHFGTVNIVDITASSVCEMLVSLLETLGKDKPGLISPDIATCLLTGIITDTNSFQNPNTTPKTLTTAAQLVAAGARQQQIVGEVYHARPLSTLRLWGRALAYLKEDAELKFAWSSLSRADFVAAQATDDEAGGIIDELLKTAAGMRCVLLLSERDGGLRGSLRSLDPSLNVQVIAERLGGGGHPMAAAFRIPGSTLKQEHDVISAIKGMMLGDSLPKLEPQQQSVDSLDAIAPSTTIEITEPMEELAEPSPSEDLSEERTQEIFPPVQVVSESESMRESTESAPSTTSEQPTQSPQTQGRDIINPRPYPPRPSRPVAKPGRTV